MSLIVLDKSWLIGTSASELTSRAKQDDYLVIAALFYEILSTARKDQRDQCFRKLKSVENSCVLIEHVGHFLNYEFTNNRKCTPIAKLALDRDFSFNKEFADRGFPFTNEQLEALEYSKNTWELDGVVDYVELAESIDSFIPELEGETSDTEIENLKKRTARDHDLIQRMMAAFKSRLPDPSLVNEDWAIYRWIQSRLIAGIDYKRKYRGHKRILTIDKLANERLDLEYLITGLLAGALASRDDLLVQNCRIASDTISIIE
ncbi:MAG: hypothetical protein ACE5HI_14165 [bacterium]